MGSPTSPLPSPSRIGLILQEVFSPPKAFRWLEGVLQILLMGNLKFSWNLIMIPNSFTEDYISSLFLSIINAFPDRILAFQWTILDLNLPGFRKLITGIITLRYKNSYYLLLLPDCLQMLIMLYRVQNYLQKIVSGKWKKKNIKKMCLIGWGRILSVAELEKWYLWNHRYYFSSARIVYDFSDFTKCFLRHFLS